jgi:hypothetical protein
VPTAPPLSSTFSSTFDDPRLMAALRKPGVPAAAPLYAGHMSDYCGSEPTTVEPAAPTAGRATAPGPPFADCVLCRQPTEYPESYQGITLCPVCEWREAERTACSG